MGKEEKKKAEREGAGKKKDGRKAERGISAGREVLYGARKRE